MAEIWDYSAVRWGDAHAERYVRRIETTMAALAADPRLGRSCDQIRAGYFKYPAGSHVIFYRLADVGIDVVRILHQGMDVDRHF
ncbi:MAG TPA: type II toxin-antitoxin system RelE/ParE family toxin [Lichenihabitans sp.]|nr:type II toxin-antitoxin system RelE/ParE family toxin [Lichenihabitans sp.]